MTDRDRFARTFANIRGAPARKDAQGEASKAPEEGTLQEPLGTQPEPVPTPQSEPVPAPEAVQPALETREPAPAENAPSFLLFDPTNPEPVVLSRPEIERDDDPWAGEKPVEVDVPLFEGASVDTRDPSAVAGEILRATDPSPSKDSHGVMAMIRQDIAYQQGKMIEEEQQKKAAPAKRSADAPKASLNRPKRSLFSIALPEFSGESLGWARGLLAVAAAAIAIVYAVSQLGLGGNRTYVHFTVQAPSARSVSVVGDFNNWNARDHELRRLPGATVWEVWVPVKPGRYRYAFIVDGQVHMVDPSRQTRFDDDLQRGVSVLVVPPRGGAPEMIGDGEASAAVTPVPAPTR